MSSAITRITARTRASHQALPSAPRPGRPRVRISGAARSSPRPAESWCIAGSWSVMEKSSVFNDSGVAAPLSFLIFDDRLDDVVERSPRREAAESARQRAVGNAALQVLVTGTVRVEVRGVADGAGGRGGDDDALGEVIDGDGLGAAQVDGPAVRGRGGHEPGEGGDHVEHMAEAADLVAGAVDGERLAGQ